MVSFCLIACNTIEHGIIVNKKLLPARSLYASGVYSQTDNRYLLIIKGENENKKMKTRKIHVSKQTYDSLSVGDYYLGTTKEKE